MRLATLFLLPILASGFVAHPVVNSPRSTLTPLKTMAEAAPLTELGDELNNKISAVLKKADSLVLNRGMRLLNHASVIYTLKELTQKLGSSRFGLDIAPSALSLFTPPGLAVPAWVGYILPVLVVSQVAAVAKSVLADNKDDLSQQEIAEMTASNFCLTRALMNSSLTNWAIAAIVSGHAARSGNADGEPNMQNLNTQIASSVTTVAAVLALAAQLPAWIPILAGQAEVTAGLGLVAYYAMVTRSGNGKVRKVVNAAVIGGVLLSKIAGGALKVSNLLRAGTLVTAGTAYVAWIAIDKARESLASDIN